MGICDPSQALNRHTSGDGALWLKDGELRVGYLPAGMVLKQPAIPNATTAGGVPALVDKVNAILASLRSAGIIAP